VSRSERRERSYVVDRLLTGGYSHKYQHLPMISAEEFIERQPEHAGDDEKNLMMARINHEHSEREPLEQERQELLTKKQALIAENKKRKDDLAGLDSDLEKFIDVSLANPPLMQSLLTSEGRQTNSDDVGKGLLKSGK